MKEIERLIAKLKLDKEILAEQDADNDETATEVAIRCAAVWVLAAADKLDRVSSPR